MSQNVFLPDLTVLWLIITVWARKSQNSFLREFCAQMSESVFLAVLIVLQLISTVWVKMSGKLISPRVLVTNITNRVLSWFERFVAYYNCMSEKVTKLISPWVLCTNVRKRVLSCFDRFTAYFYCMSENVRKTHISASSRHKYHKSCS